MKKLISLVIALGFLFTGNAFGQQDATVTIPDVMPHPIGTIEVPVEVNFTLALEGVCNFQFYIHYDEDHLTYMGVDNKHFEDIFFSLPDPLDPPNPILIIWSNTDPADFEGKILDLLFEYDGGGDAEIWFGNVPPEDSTVGDCVDAKDYENVDFSGGFVSLAPFVPLRIWAAITALGLIAVFVIVKRGRFF